MSSATAKTWASSSIMSGIDVLGDGQNMGEQLDKRVQVLAYIRQHLQSLSINSTLLEARPSVDRKFRGLQHRLNLRIPLQPPEAARLRHPVQHLAKAADGNIQVAGGDLDFLGADLNTLDEPAILFISRPLAGEAHSLTVFVRVCNAEHFLGGPASMAALRASDPSGSDWFDPLVGFCAVEAAHALTAHGRDSHPIDDLDEARS
jgi:hypothetical protein